MVDAHGAPRGDVARQQRDAEQQDRHGDECHRVRCGDAIEHARHQPRQQERGDDSDAQASERQFRYLPKD